MEECKHELIDYVQPALINKSRKTHGEVKKFAKIPMIQTTTGMGSHPVNYAVHYCPDCGKRMEWVAK